MNAFTHPNALIALPCATALVEPKPPQECPTRTTAPLVRWAMKEEMYAASAGPRATDSLE
jgi:hypothetical protein